MLALYWHSTIPYYAFYCAGIFDVGLTKTESFSHTYGTKVYTHCHILEILKGKVSTEIPMVEPA